jgi:serine/threonine protein kinase/WD40 repeat protein
MQEQSIFIEALEREDPAERAAFLDEVCANDATLRRRIERLLQRHQDSGSFLEDPTPGWDTPFEKPVGECPGATVGPYKLMEQIGEGGMGVVYVAEQQQPVRRRVALKVIKPGMDSKQVVARFEAERQVLALMDHPNIAHVLDGGTTPAGRPYFVMELVRGVPITAFCDDNRLTPCARLPLFVSVCQAVQHAHQKGIIHRDLKPSNVLVTSHDGTPVVKVIDFGIAKAIGQQLTDKTIYTRFMQMVGTPLYMSPEQAGQSGLDIDTRTDVYALGVLLYELLTGTTPFDGERLRQADNEEIRRIIREEEPARPSTRISTLGETLPAVAAQRRTDPKRLRQLFRGELDWIVMKALEKDRNQRYESASAFAADVQRYLNDEPVQACPPSPAYRLRKLVRRHRGSVLAASLIFLALVAGILGTTWGMIRATAAQDGAVNEAKQKKAALATAQDQLFLALLNRARAGRYSRQMGQRLESLDAVEQAAGIHPDERLRDEAIAALALPDVRRVPGWYAASPGTAAVAYGRQYRLYARNDPPGGISIRSLPDDREIRRVASDAILANCLQFSPDDRFLAGLDAKYRLSVWRVADGQPVLRDELIGCRSHAFSPDSRRLAVGWQEWVLCFDLETGQEVKRWRVPARAHGLAFHPDNNRLAVGYFDSGVASVFDAATGALLVDLPVGMMAEQVVAWHPDGERLAVTGTDPRIQIWNVAAKRKVATLVGHNQYVESVTFHPDGELMASHGWDGQLLLWHPASGQQLMRLTSTRAPQFSADGRLLGVVWEGDRADLLEVTPSREYRTLVNSAGPGGGGYCFGDFSPDGRLLAVGMDSGARLWDLRDGRELAVLPTKAPFVFFEGSGADGGPASPPWRLLTAGPAGLLRWPVTSEDAEGKHLRLGPPQQLSALPRAWFARSPEGRTLAAVTVEGKVNQILDLETGAVRRELGKHEYGEVRALSGDGRWAASSGWHSDRVQLWNVATGQPAKEWVVGKRAFVYFTPDSRTLIIAGGDEFSFWNVEPVELIRRLPRDVALYPSQVAFSPDGRLMALEMAPGVLHLKEVATAHTVAKLEDPHGDWSTWHGFTPDGTRLVVASSYTNAVHVWDLRAIRTRLKDMNLDWDWPEFPPAPTGEPAAAPMTVEILPGDLVKPLTREQKAQRAIERSRRAVEADPNAARPCNDLAWDYLAAPEALRDVEAALPLAEKAVRLAPEKAMYRNTLGLAYYRAGRYREAVAVLGPNVEKQEDWALAYDLYFLAMSHHHLGETTRARDYYDWAVRWVATQRDLKPEFLEELTAFRAEAEELLGIDRKKD